MQRRALLLAAASSTAVTIGGCLADETPSDDTSSDAETDGANDTSENESENDSKQSDDRSDRQEPPYEECDRKLIWYSGLPDPIAAEVDEAFADGTYETTDDLYYDQAVDVENSWLEKDDAYYRGDVDVTDQAETSAALQFEPDTPKKSTDQELTIRNHTDEERDLTVTVVDSEGETRLEESIESLDTDATESFSVARAYGDYEVTVERDDEASHTQTWTIRYTEFDAMATLGADGLEVHAESVMDPPPCPWE